ncbi:protein ZBED8-like [Octopus bimaculoides]|uniref:protein ZBED8-like n=1 Tax=Octopus bimaculoides TaxID=37653 RepID=UPI00071E372D|nr:protein ZBED8-like [Octopus bimaculoides]|eukprot:XP_014790427.1 PREDICTED: protein ZBED8-like [Octopus bimaculoides]
MADDIEDQLCIILKKTEFSLQLDESALPGNDSLLLAYVRFVKEESLCQELLFARLLETNSKGESIFNVVKSFIGKKDIPLNNIVACATDGAPSMIGCHRGFISYLKVSLPDVFTMHSVIH